MFCLVKENCIRILFFKFLHNHQKPYDILWYVPRILSVMTLQFVSCVTDFKTSCNSRITQEPITCNMAHGQKHKYTLMILNNLEISYHCDFLTIENEKILRFIFLSYHISMLLSVNVFIKHSNPNPTKSESRFAFLKCLHN